MSTPVPTPPPAVPAVPIAEASEERRSGRGHRRDSSGGGGFSGDDEERTPRESERTPRGSDKRNSRSPGGSRAHPSQPAKPAKHKVRHRKQRQGQTIYKGHPSWKMMINIKLGISITVGKVSAQEPRELRLADFNTVTRQEFPPEGSPLTPGHSSETFKFDDHAPLAFRHLREHFGVHADDYLVSICGECSLRELGTPGKSGAVFYLTEDGKFLIKTVSRKESKFLRQILPNYYNYVMRSENTLLPRFFGLIRITTANHRRIRLVIFNNLLPQSLSVHEKYDLKGSTLGRYATPEEKRDPNVTLKDLDFNHTMLLSHKNHQLLRGQIESDLAWLRTLQIMDYSLLLLLNFPARQEMEDRSSEAGEPSSSGGRRTSADYGANYDTRGGPGASAPAAAAATGRSVVDVSDADGPAAVVYSEGSASASGDRYNTSVSEEAPPPAGAEASVAHASSDAPASAAAASGAAAGYAEPSLASSVAEDGDDDGDGDAEGGDGDAEGGDGDAEGGDDDDDDDEHLEGSVSRRLRRGFGAEGSGEGLPLSLPKLTDADFASAFHKARMSTWSSRKDFAIDDGVEAQFSTGEKVLIFGGLIDILQVYGARKKLEHQYKSLRFRNEREGISVTDPGKYASRMSAFVWSKFCEAPRVGADGASLSTHPEETSVDLERSATLGSSAAGGSGSAPPTPREGSATSPHTPHVGSASSSIGLSGIVQQGEQPLLSGDIMKKGTSFPYAWGLRYCAVYSSSRTMIYYSNQADFVSGGVVRGKKVIRAVNKYLPPNPPGEPKADHMLDVTLDTGKTMLIKLASIGERDRWYAALDALFQPADRNVSISSAGMGASGPRLTAS